ncbi:MAG: hypothetical protein SFT94_03980 [Pseudanabaenaceae cyanobacterium bins.68]|nr:hypothetical protein [Pseudanabaenaceae cyanobacterium bins.68]
MKLAVPRLTYDPPLPLAMYYELAAHLSQIPGLKLKLLRWQDLDQSRSVQFDYQQSQIAALQLELELDLLADLIAYLESLPWLSAELDIQVPVQLSSAQQAFISSLLPPEFLNQASKFNQALVRLLSQILAQILAVYGCWRVC